MPRFRTLTGFHFRAMEIDNALVLLRQFRMDGFTHVRMYVSKKEVVPRKVKPDTRAYDAVPGKIRMNGEPGKMHFYPRRER